MMFPFSLMCQGVVVAKRHTVEPLSSARSVFVGIVARIDIAPGEMMIRFAARGLHRALGLAYEKRENPSADPTGSPATRVPFAIRRRGVEGRLIVGDLPHQATNVDAGLVEVICRARRWLRQLHAEGRQTIASLSRQLDVDDGEISRILPLAFLAPDIAEAILDGRQPAVLTARKLSRIKPLPVLRAEQRRVLGFVAI